MTTYTDIFSKQERVEDMEQYVGAVDVNEQLARYGVKFRIYKNNEFKEQLFPFDMIPRDCMPKCRMQARNCARTCHGVVLRLVIAQGHAMVLY